MKLAIALLWAAALACFVPGDTALTSKTLAKFKAKNKLFLLSAYNEIDCDQEAFLAEAIGALESR